MAVLESPQRKPRVAWEIAFCRASTAFLLLTAPGCAKHAELRPASVPTAPSQAVAGTPSPGDGTTLTPTLASSPAAPPPAARVVSAPPSEPNPLAPPCTADAHCLTHRCNVAAQRCAWPCQSDNDCMPGNACIAPTCLP